MKRTADQDLSAAAEKRQRTKKQWRVPRKAGQIAREPKVIEPGDSGIWATCTKGKEGQCVGELLDLFTEYAEILYGDTFKGDTTIPDATDTVVQPSASIENEIRAEIADIQRPGSTHLFTPIRIDTPCVTFFKTVAPVEPVAFVKKICEDAMRNSHQKRTRFAKRLSPMTLMGRASEEGLEKIAKEVLPPYFQQQPFRRCRFAIRPTLRNHNALTRDGIIKQVASIVGQGHEVNLRDYDLLIVVEVHQNVCGISVLDNTFEGLKRHNLAEIFDPTPNEGRGAGKIKETIAPSDNEPAKAMESGTAMNTPATSMSTL